MRRLTERKEVARIEGETGSVCRDEVVVEAPLAIFLNGEKLVTLLCTPEREEQLALGFLRSGGLLDSLDEVLRVETSAEGDAVRVDLKRKTGSADRPRGGWTLASGGVRGVVPGEVGDLRGCPPLPGNTLAIGREQIGALMESLQDRSRIFKATGGTHSAALADGRGIILFAEDIGRHNAVDKIIGECLLRGIPVGDKALLCSGRLGSEILRKAARLRVPLLISRAAPTTLSIELAAAQNITVVGFARGRRMNIYTHPFRVKG